MRSYPAWVSGTGSDGRKLMEAVPGLVHKVGAEAVDAFALPDGRAAALKIDDGNQRARTPVTAAILRRLGAEVPGEFTTAPVTGGDEIVGNIRATVL
jgi:L-asparaginase II